MLPLLWLTGLLSVTTALANADTTKTYAVIIGISEYQQESLRTLQFADKDAALFAAYLRSPGGGNVPDSNMKVLLNTDATIAAIYDALNWLQESCEKNDKAYFYFSGHGDVETQNSFSLGYLLAYNSPATNYRNNAIRIEDLNTVANHLSVSSNATVVLVTDACHTGKLAGDYYKGKQLVASQLRLILNNEVRLAACAVDEKAVEGPEWGGGRGVFSYYLLKGLNGMADINQNDTIQLRELQTYLDSAFATDKALIRLARKQRPALDGNPYQPVAFVIPGEIRSRQAESADEQANAQLPKTWSTFKPVGVQPIDYFFRLMKTRGMPSKLPFGSYAFISKDSLPHKILDDCIAYQRQMDSLTSADPENADAYLFASKDTLILLQKQLQTSKALVSNFHERFIQTVHGQAQEMVNAYLEGDEAELEKRQYYDAGNRRYRDFLAMFRIALAITPARHYLHPLLVVQEAYLAGLTARLEMVTSANDGKLLADAFRHQRRALALEPYAAYIYNELGNLYLRSNQYAQADRHYNLAMEYAPAWAIPWSNQIRLNLATGKLKKATVAIHKADSLQNNLSYTWMNAGLVMAKSGNLLASESYFRKAIAQNNVHYLPYQKLGELYITTGEFRAADRFLADAQARRARFAINDRSFKYGIELGGPPPVNTDTSSFPNLPTGTPANTPLTRLMHTLASMPARPDSALDALKTLIPELHAGRHLANHYIGKILSDRKKWQEALPFLREAAHTYQSDSLLAALVHREQNTDSSAVVAHIPFQYDPLADHYMLGSIYEQLDSTESARSEYLMITRTENQRQRDQAAFKGLEATSNTNALPMSPNAEELIARYESPLPMGGYIKLANLHEHSGDYLMAEKVYQEQISRNRQAGNLRKVQTRRGPFQLMAGTDINFYWLAINRAAEAQTYAFYQRALRRFARDSEWQRKAGMFLYERLRMAFLKTEPERHQAVYKSITLYAYPFATADETGSQPEISFTVPGTDERIRIATPKYDPLQEALQSLELSVRLSGALLPDPVTTEAIADLQSWMGNEQAALKSYQALIAMQEPDGALRRKLIDYYFSVFEYNRAVDQLEILRRLGQISPAQNRKLAECYALSGSSERSVRIMGDLATSKDVSKTAIAMLNAKTNWLAGRYAPALAYVNSIPAPNEANADDSIKEARADRYYAIARLNALLKRNTNALLALQKALKFGFDLGHVLRIDPAWKMLRGSPEWKRLQRQYAAQLEPREYLPQQFDGWQSALNYRIPD